MIECDVLVIGSGFAGLWAAITAADAGAERVAVVDKGAIAMSSQSKMSAGATVYCLPGDDIDLWVREYAEAQGWLSRQDMVTEILATSYDRLRRLEEWGVEYETMPGASTSTPPTERYIRLPSRGFKHVKMMVAPHWRKRVGGSAVVAALRNQLIRRRIARFPHRLVTELQMDGGRISGAMTVDRRSGETESFSAAAVVLAASDCSFRGNYACADSVTGDAFRLAFDAGARLTNMEFLCVNTGSPEFGFEGTGVALRFGGKLTDTSGRQFVEKYHPEGDSAEVSALVQSMAREVEAGNGPPFYLDLSGGKGGFLEVALDRMGGFMPINVARLRERGTDIYAAPQEWEPAIQTLRGGLRTDIDCASDISGLYAAGLSQAVDPCLFNGWSSMRAMWSGERAGRSAAEFARVAGPVVTSGANQDAHVEAAMRAVEALGGSGSSADDVLIDLQGAVFPWGVSILKNESRLLAALDRVVELKRDVVPAMGAADPHELVKVHETASMVSVAELFLRASLARTESRTDHFREDHPDTENPQWCKWVNLSKAAADEVKIEFERVPFGSYPEAPPFEVAHEESAHEESTHEESAAAP